MRWVISLPAWGNERRDLFLQGPLQSVLRALAHAGIDKPLLIINTDWLGWFKTGVDQAVAESKPDAEVRFYYVPDNIAQGQDSYGQFGECHQQAIDLAEPGDHVALLCADMTVSIEAFAAADRVFARGKQLILAAASSTVGEAPVGARSRKLLDWSLDNLTPMCRDLFWQEGRGSFPWCVYFRHDHGVDFRGFHLHPFALVKRAGLKFRGITSDIYLSEEFPTEQVYVVQDPDELALVERSPRNRRRPLGFKVRTWTVVGWAVAMDRNNHLSARHPWHFSHQITLQGRPDPDNNQAAAAAIVKRINAHYAISERRRRKRAVRDLYAAHRAAA